MNKVMSFRSKRPSPLSLDGITNVESNGLVGFCWKIHADICNSKSEGLYDLLDSREGVHVDMVLITEHNMTSLYVVASLPNESPQKLPLMKWLLRQGAKVDARDTLDRLPLDIVSKMNDQDAIELLRSYQVTTENDLLY